MEDVLCHGTPNCTPVPSGSPDVAPTGASSLPIRRLEAHVDLSWGICARSGLFSNVEATFPDSVTNRAPTWNDKRTSYENGDARGSPHEPVHDTASPLGETKRTWSTEYPARGKEGRDPRREGLGKCEPKNNRVWRC